MKIFLVLGLIISNFVFGYIDEAIGDNIPFSMEENIALANEMEEALPIEILKIISNANDFSFTRDKEGNIKKIDLNNLNLSHYHTGTCHPHCRTVCGYARGCFPVCDWHDCYPRQ